jgi:hypothetical protein
MFKESAFLNRVFGSELIYIIGYAFSIAVSNGSEDMAIKPRDEYWGSIS